MNWFKKLSCEKAVNPHNEKAREQRHKRIKKTPERSNTNSNDEVIKPSSSLYSRHMEILDPEEFFHDPEHVRNYKEEAEFLELMSEWEIIPNPANITNFFSADFEDELLQQRTQSVPAYEKNVITTPEEPEYTSYGKRELSAARALRKRKRKTRFCDMLFKEKIQLGLVPPEHESHTTNHMKCKPKFSEATHKTSRSTITSSLSSLQMSFNGVEETPIRNACANQVIKDCAINRNQLKTEALASSIMGAIGKCPDRDSTPRSSEADLITNSGDLCHPTSRINHDHYDIKQFFRLDDCGNILLSTNHITETRGFGLTVTQNKRLYKRYRKLCRPLDEEIVHISCFEVLKRFLLWLWYLICGEFD
uniref:Uncharacterized protein n=1 Tax=Bactrocera latifrons TaxID=174628 RepID=A0A0K8TXA7_BACLA